MSLGDSIKKLAAAAEDNAAPAAFLFGMVTGTDPLRVMMDSRFELGETFLVIPDHIREGGFATGDSLVVLRNRGGEQYLILGKVGGNGNAGTG